MSRAKYPAVKTIPDAVALRGGLDLVTPPLESTPGNARFAVNYEALFEGGYERIGGFERFDGRPRPSDAAYAISVPAVSFAGVVVGNTVTGLTSGTTGVVIAVLAATTTNPQYIVLTKMTGAFTVGETLQVAAVTIGVHSATTPTITGFDDNHYSYLAAEQYRPAIQKPTGANQIRGVAILNSAIYSWRDNGGSLGIWKATSGGWTGITLYNEVSFTAGSVAPVEGNTITQGANSATVKRVVLETGTWLGGTAAGRLIVTTPAPGNFAAGALTAGGTLTLSGAQTAITLTAGGKVKAVIYNFSGAAGQKRLYGCDGINREFEFDGDVLVPLTTGMGAIRATQVFCHKNQLAFAYKGSVQLSGIVSPYQWTPLTGAAELGTGDTITGFCPVGGSEVSSALMVFCQDSVWVLYGNNSTDWKLVKISDEAGANAHSAQDIGKPMTHDTPGFRSWNATQAYGNFQWEIDSRLIDPIARQLTPVASCYVKAKSRYRCFFSDGSCVTATPMQNKGTLFGGPVISYQWMSISYGVTVVEAVSGEVNGVTRTFYGDTQGWVFEADVGRSFDGADISYSCKLVDQHQKSPTTVKQYRRAELECEGFSAFQLDIGAEFSEGDPDVDPTWVITFQQLTNFGSALVWDGAFWDRAVWDAGEASVKRVQLQGQGTSVATIFGGTSHEELPHQVKSLMWQFTPLRNAI